MGRSIVGRMNMSGPVYDDIKGTSETIFGMIVPSSKSDLEIT